MATSKSSTGGMSGGGTGVAPRAAPASLGTIYSAPVVAAPVAARVAAPVSAPVAAANTIANIGLPAANIAPTAGSKVSQVGVYNAPSNAAVSTATIDKLLADNKSKNTDPNILTGDKLKSLETKGKISSDLGNLASVNSSVAKGAAALNLIKNEAPVGMSGTLKPSYTGDFNTAAKALGVDLAPFAKITTGPMGTKVTTLDKDAAYNAINSKANEKNLYAITERQVGSSGSGKNAVHTTTLYQGAEGNLQPVLGQDNKPLTSSFKADTFTKDEGFFGGLISGVAGIAETMQPILIAMGAANGLNYILNGINSAGVTAGTLDAVKKSTSDIAFGFAKDIGGSIARDQISKEYGATAGNVAGFGLNATGFGRQDVFGTGGIAKTLDTGNVTGALTSDQVAGGGQPYDWTGTGGVVSGYGGGGVDLGDYVDDAINISTGASGFPINDITNVSTGASGFPINDITNVSTGASGFPLNLDILNNAATSSTPNGDGTTTFNFDDGSSITADNAGNVFNTTDSTGTVIGGSSGLPGYTGSLTGPFQPGGGGVTTGGGTSGAGTGGVGTGGTGGTAGGVDLGKALSGLSNYQAAGSAAQAAAAIYAANQQAQAAKYAQDLQQKRFDLINAQFAPQRGAGYSALNQIRGMLPGQYQQYSETGAPTTMATGTDYLTRQFGPQDLYAGLAPNYNFMLGQGQQAAQRQANVGGGALGGNAQAALQRYTQDYAGNAYQNAFGNFQTQRGNIYNTLAGIAGIGQTAQNTTAQAGQAATNAISQLGVGSAAAQAAGITGAANAVAGGLQNYGVNQTLAQILGQNQNVAQNPNAQG